MRCVYIYIQYTYTYTYTYIYIHIHIHVYIYVYIYTHMSPTLILDLLRACYTYMSIHTLYTNITII